MNYNLRLGVYLVGNCNWKIAKIRGFTPLNNGNRRMRFLSNNEKRLDLNLFNSMTDDYELTIRYLISEMIVFSQNSFITNVFKIYDQII